MRRACVSGVYFSSVLGLVGWVVAGSSGSELRVRIKTLAMMKGDFTTSG